MKDFVEDMLMLHWNFKLSLWYSITSLESWTYNNILYYNQWYDEEENFHLKLASSLDSRYLQDVVNIAIEE